MRKLGITSDSLELLLDTVCSMFGAILLIAILVALMAQTGKVSSSSEQASAEMLQRKIALAKTDLEETNRLLSLLAVPTENRSGALAEEKRQVNAALETARREHDLMDSQLQDYVAHQTVDYSTEWKNLTAQLSALDLKQEELSNSIKAQDQNTARVNGRVAEISKLIQEEKEARVVTLRFPKERTTSKRALPIICKFGKIYPLFDVNGHKNETSIAWTGGGENRLSRPVESLGWSMIANRSDFEELLKSVGKDDFYFAFYVYPDSFEAFRSVREQAVAASVDFGFELEDAGTELRWGSEGTSPPPL